MSFEFNFTQDHLAQILPGNQYVAQWYEALTKILPDYSITSIQCVAQFLAQSGHESGGYAALHENLNYRWESLRRVFGKYFPTDALAQQYEHKPEMIANRVYANRMGNGDEASGDGYRYCGRGLIQITGHDNYQNFADSIQIPVEQLPEYLETFEGAVQSACWFWETHDLNSAASTGDTVHVTQIVNGGQNGIDDRLARYHHAINILSA